MMPRLGAAEPIGAAAATAAAESQFEDPVEVALSQCAAEAIGAMRVGATDIGAATAIGAMVSVRQRSARPLLARTLLALVRTAVTATTLMATGFAATNPSSLALGARPASTSRSTPVRDANWVTVMTLVELERMSADDLWKLHVEIGEALAARLTAEKDVLEERLKQLAAKPHAERRVATSERRPYPAVLPKFRNPDDPSQTWTGRGKQPRWLTAKLRSGKMVDEFRI